MKLSPLALRVSDPIWSVWRGSFSITSLIKSPPVEQAQGWAGTDLGWGGSGACRERGCSEPGRRLNSSYPSVLLAPTSLFLRHSLPFCWYPEGEYQGEAGEEESRGRPVAQWWLSHLVIIAGQAHWTVSSVPSHPIPDTVLPSTEIHQTPSLGPCPPVGRVLSAGVFSFFKGQRWVLGSAVFPGIQINLRLGSSISSTGLFDESVGQWHALAVLPWSLAFFSCHFPPHLSARVLPASSTWVAHKLRRISTSVRVSNILLSASLNYQTTKTTSTLKYKKLHQS